jgi:hypothetical protein
MTWGQCEREPPAIAAPGRWLAAIVLLTTAARLILGYVFFGFHTGDDVEILEAGFRRALGWPYEPWAIRNLLVSDLLVAPVLRLGAALGIGSVETLVWLGSLPFVALASVNVWLVYRLTLRWCGGSDPAVVAAALYACHWIPLGYGTMVYPRTAAVTAILLAALTLLAPIWSRWRAAGAGGLVAVAWAFRYSEAVFLLPLCAALWLRGGRVRDRVLDGVALGAGFALGSLVTVGLIDALTWGEPFASLLAFADYTLVERQASALEPNQPWYWYLRRLPKWLPLTLLPLLWRARTLRGSLAVALFVVLPLLALSAIHHKTLRYLQGVIPFVTVLGAAGWWLWWREGRRRLAAVLCALSLLLGLSGITFLAKKSMAAVVAARAIAAGGDGGPVALSQAWAYGDDLYLGQGAGIVELGYPLDAGALVERVAGCRWVAFYEKELARSPQVEPLLAEAGFDRFATHRWGRSEPVVVYRRGAAAQ